MAAMRKLPCPLTLPSITATQELVVPKSMPMTSSALTAEDTLKVLCG